MEDNHKLDTLSERMNFLRDKGYTEEFSVQNNMLTTHDHAKTYGAKQVKINEHYRFEGESDPGDMTVLYAIETEDGTKGIVMDGFGTYSTAGMNEFIQRIEELHKGKIY